MCERNVPTIEVEAINPVQRLVVTSDGRTFSMTNLFDEFGDETEDAAVAVKAFCGTDDYWFIVKFADFEAVMHG
jgi:hypothetical protein